MVALQELQAAMQVVQLGITVFVASLDLYVLYYIVGIWRNKRKLGYLMDKWVGQAVSDDAKLVACLRLLKQAAPHMTDPGWQAEYEVL